MGTQGRRGRRKRRKKDAQVTLCHELQFADLRRWLKLRGFRSKVLVPAQFKNTGRGLMSTESIKANDVMIALPESCLLTTRTVLKSYIGEYLKRWMPPVSPLLALCVFLISERHFARSSEWWPYISVLPQTYTCPVYFSDSVMNLLPSGLRTKAVKQRQQVKELHESSAAFFTSLQPLFSQPMAGIFSYDALRWAWCSVNTRTVYMRHDQSPYLSTEPDVYALAPYLDLLNHCPDVQVEAGFSPVSGCYEVRSVQGCRRFHQAFICYGPHDSQRLLLEYGFVAPGNPHAVVYVGHDTLKLCFDTKDRQLSQKMLFLKENGFLVNLTFSLEGPSWRLMTALRLLSLKPDQYDLWKSVLLGAAVSQDREKWSIQKAQMLCQLLLEESIHALEELADLKEGTDSSLKNQLAVVESLRHEEKAILGCSQEMLGIQRQQLPCLRATTHNQAD
ncbi:SET domain-containing protein 4 isoform X2 [Denticeps clupeoides]|uniref:SET domain-containing protein 4 isoform X2 n=1 Tax=Denticeps clupeoides TaxID=299321 RepID=UPI0010A3FF37|nr:SET domain-containing protein 4 isoform X2 [Denticeps clupeoides]XP_028837323.1 SET domain-containing protein 4 isoform X2 [Denticeps clupeoides]XP_028837324.1 SET domain-containing protein 4 isoform X2 [Denticeps clupeoides]